jgi:uncharacterized protein YcbX
LELQTEPGLKTHLEQATVTGLFYYPIKSCGGWQVEEAELTETGLKHDRELMVVDPDNHVLTQRELARMALIKPRIEGDYLRVEAPGMATLETLLIKEGPQKAAVIWDDTCQTVDQGDEVANWFSEFLNTEARLVRMAPDFKRTLDPKYSLSQQDHTNFADGYPLLLISEESLEDLNSRLHEPLPMNRFRPNLVIKGSGIPFTEDKLKRIQIGEVVLDIVKTCARCAITTTDQETTLRGKEPLRTLATYRRDAKGGVIFGQNVIHENTGTLRVGERLKVLELK